MSWQIIPLEEVAPTAWRNGGGITRELLAWPVAQDWDWRISVAEVEKSGPFSPYEGVQRWFAVLGGAGVRLTLGEQVHELTAQSSPLCFDGAQACACELVDGPTEDFNLMLKDGRGSARLVRVLGALDVKVKPGTRVAVYAWDEPVTVQVNRKFVTVPPHTLAWRALADGASVRIEASTALWMEMAR
ncbi:MAG: HutD family protein [Polaromonas sp.]|uniref:HutD/Ves family protein n=1 Tax=Polaromonas sp. TaxID=1869339 RepID=UPI0024882392|nr:HutD family protein [Polaromonas sp.]MDI1237502.1 HutD family protein [Polaromonas sp.]MDI1338973.1 HutD family protein [Polaromonas sp.]